MTGNQTSGGRKRIDLNIECLRGYAALSVVFNHLLSYNGYLDPHYFPQFLKFLTPPGHLSVLIFFLLSGYVIQISHSGTNRLTRFNYTDYIKKRLLRLYPIYLVVILFTLLIANTRYNFGTILSNLTFTQNIFAPTIKEDDPIWSLSYEVVFYLLFIPISLYRIKPFRIILISVLIAFVLFFLTSHNFSILSSYLVGLVFWISGLVVARYLKKDELHMDKLLLSNLFLFLALPILIENTVDYFFPNVSMREFLNYPEGFRVKIRNLFFLPYCFIFISNFSNRTFFKKKTVLTVLQLLPLLSSYPIALLIKQHHYTVAFGIVTYGISSLLYFADARVIQKITALVIKTGTWLGGISYAIYLVHFPLLISFGKIHFFTGTAISYIFRFILFLFILINAAYFLEKIYQPYIKKFIRPSGKRTQAISPSIK